MKKLRDPASAGDAKNYAFLLLKFRQRSREELYQRLKNKKFNPDTIEKTLDFLQEKGFVDDEAFARTWINCRVKRPLGLYRIRRELNLKGVNKEIINAALEEAKKDYREDEVVHRLAKERSARAKGGDPKKTKQRIYAYLLRRGFSAEAIIKALSNL